MNDLPDGRRPRTPLGLSRRATGQIMLGVAVVGSLAALMGTVVAWQLIGGLGDSTDRSLELAQDSLVALDGTLDLVEGVVTAVEGSLDNVDATLRMVSQALREAGAASDTSAQISAELAPGLRQVDQALAALQSVTQTLDRALRQLSTVPFGPNYNPDIPLDQSIGLVRADLEPISEQLEEISAELAELADTSDELADEMTGLQVDVGALRGSLAGSTELLESYRVTTAEAAGLARETRRDLGGDLTRSRALAVVLGLTITMGHLVPAWLGRELLLAGAEDQPRAL